MIEQAKSNYYKISYQKYLRNPSNSIIALLNETENPSTNIENQYPLYKFFYVDDYPNEDDFISKFESIENFQYKYPAIFAYLYLRNQINELEIISLINPFANYMINNYSFKITRQNAKDWKIKDELVKIGKEVIKQMFTNFKQGFNKLCSQGINNLPMKTIREEDKLSFCLNDDKEPENGYLYSMYNKLICIQNDLINFILEKKVEYIEHFKERLFKPISIQSATKKEIISLTINNKISDFSSFLDLISFYSYKKCYNESGNINYLDYKYIFYNFDKIEEELTNILLTGKRKFYESLNFVVYRYESFGGNTSLIEDFIQKYEQEMMVDDEKDKLTKFIQQN